MMKKRLCYYYVLLSLLSVHLAVAAARRGRGHFAVEDQDQDQDQDQRDHTEARQASREYQYQYQDQGQNQNQHSLNRDGSVRRGYRPSAHNHNHNRRVRTNTKKERKGKGIDEQRLHLPGVYKYSIETDCYREGRACPKGSFCQVAERHNWYPFDVSYINRGRCLQYAPMAGACNVPFEGSTSFPRKDDGEFFERSTLCDPEEAACTGDHVLVLPAQCVQRRDPKLGCQSTRENGCAGRPSLAECPNDEFCFFPVDSEEGEEAPINNRMTPEKLAQCGAIVTSFNGPNFAFVMQDKETGEWDLQPNDDNIEAGQVAPVKKIAMERGFAFAPQVQKMLQTLWPYQVCDTNTNTKQGNTEDDCTSFPLPVPARDDDGGLIAGKCLDAHHRPVDCTSVSDLDMSFLKPFSSNGVTDYHCTWAVLHMMAFNGNAVLTPAEQLAFGELIMYISGQFDCKVCRNNFGTIVKHYGLPTGFMRQDYARWMWQAHNNANEHSYATHSLNLTQASKILSVEQPSLSADEALEQSFTMTRTNQWVNPRYMHPWFTTFEDATTVWAGAGGLANQYA